MDYKRSKLLLRKENKQSKYYITLEFYLGLVLLCGEKLARSIVLHGVGRMFIG
jgi:hypothetical protein